MFTGTQIIWFYIVGIIVSYFAIGIYNYAKIRINTKRIETDDIARIIRDSQPDKYAKYKENYIYGELLNGWACLFSWFLILTGIVILIALPILSIGMTIENFIVKLKLTPTDIIEFIVKSFKKIFGGKQK
jgi:hypothetical protein